MNSPERDQLHRAQIQLLQHDLFAGLGPELLATCADSVRLQHFSRGSLLTRQGEMSDRFYVIVAGTAEVVLERPDGSEELVDVLTEGDCLGDLAILLDQPRTATVRAIRNCQAIGIDSQAFLRLHAAAPDFALRLSRILAQRLQRTTRERIRKREITTATAILLSRSPVVLQIVEALSGAIADLPGPSVTLRTVSVADFQVLPDILAESDITLLVGDAGGQPDHAVISMLLDLHRDVRPKPPVNLLLCHGAGVMPSGTQAWLGDSRLQGWHHARLGDDGDPGRIARIITGRATGLALSGGGARGFGHIGVLRALAERNLPIDFIAGASMGAIMAAQFAAGFSFEQMIAETRRAYIGQGALSDITFPSVALYSGRGTDRKLKSMFGERRIEDLPIRYFAVAADLRTAESVVLENGPVWRATRISCSIPGMLPPTEQDGRLLVDGGLLDNLPVEALRQRCGGMVIASDVSVAVEFTGEEKRKVWPWSRKHRRTPGIAQIMMRTAQLASVRDSREAGTPADLYLNPQFNDVGMSDFARIDEIVDRAATHAGPLLQDWGKDR